MTVAPEFEYYKNYVEMSYDDFSKDSLNEYKSRVACMFAYHMTDVLKEKYKLDGISNVQENLGNKVEGYTVVQAVCNVSKHYKDAKFYKTPGSPAEKINMDDVGANISFYTWSDGTEVSWGDGTSIISSNSGIYLNFRTEKYNILDSLTTVLAHWKTELRRFNLAAN